MCWINGSRTRSSLTSGGRCRLVRYAGDAVMLFEHEQCGRRVLAVLGKRLGRFGLSLHETKTRCVDFRPKRSKDHNPDAASDFLDFTHVWAKSQQGYPVVRQITAQGRFARSVRAVNEWCRVHRHDPLRTQQVHLARVIRGHCNYYGLRGNSARLSCFRFQVVRLWRKWLSRRSCKSALSWDRMTDLLRRHPLPTARVRPAP